MKMRDFGHKSAIFDDLIADPTRVTPPKAPLFSQIIRSALGWPMATMEEKIRFNIPVNFASEASSSSKD